MENPFVLVYWEEPALWTAIFAIIITPVYWILVSWLEYRTHVLRRLFCSSHVAVLIFAISQIFMLSYRNMRFLMALQHQPKWSTLQENHLLWLGYTMFVVGTFLVTRSFFSLGFVATFMGDFFGLCLPNRVTKFPYSWMKHPMYTGSFMMFLGISIVDTSQAGLLLSLLAGFMYTLAAFWEEPYTDLFYMTYPKMVRSVGVQVSCTSQLVWVPCRTVAVQTGTDVDIIDQDTTEYLEAEVEEESEAVQTDGARPKCDIKDGSFIPEESLANKTHDGEKISNDVGKKQQKH